MRFLRILPAIVAISSWPLSSSTLNVALGRSSFTTPGNSRMSSLAMVTPIGVRPAEAAGLSGRAYAPERAGVQGESAVGHSPRPGNSTRSVAALHEKGDPADDGGAEKQTDRQAAQSGQPCDKSGHDQCRE